MRRQDRLRDRSIKRLLLGRDNRALKGHRCGSLGKPPISVKPADNDPPELIHWSRATGYFVCDCFNAHLLSAIMTTAMSFTTAPKSAVIVFCRMGAAHHISEGDVACK